MKLQPIGAKLTSGAFSSSEQEQRQRRRRPQERSTSVAKEGEPEGRVISE